MEVYERMIHHNWRASEIGFTTPSSCLPVVVTTPVTFVVPPSSTVVQSHTLTYTPTCSDVVIIPSNTSTNKTPQEDEDGQNELPTSSLRDAFYASTIPMAYSIAMTITVSYILLFLLLLSTPRPWLQKVACLTVVICLTIAFAETTQILELEYYEKGENWVADTETGSAKEVRVKVVGGNVIRAGRVISDLFLWLAQVQTLIRLFPRHREKIIIKWAGFALIVLDTIFSILVHIISPATNGSPSALDDAVPALSYLFQIALSLLYALCVIYYSLSSRIRRFAYYHPKAPNNVIIAFLSIVSVLIPMIFFILDIGRKDLAAWGDYVRWVGAAAASVVVWEWVDRIERLEREERKEGVLGREIFDGDDGLVDDMGVPEEDASDRGNSKKSIGGPTSEKRGGGGSNGSGGAAIAFATGSGSANPASDSASINRYSRSTPAVLQNRNSLIPRTQTTSPSATSTTYNFDGVAINTYNDSSINTSNSSRQPSSSLRKSTDSRSDSFEITEIGPVGSGNDRHLSQALNEKYNEISFGTIDRGSNNATGASAHCQDHQQHGSSWSGKVSSLFKRRGKDASASPDVSMRGTHPNDNKHFQWPSFLSNLPSPFLASSSSSTSSLPPDPPASRWARFHKAAPQSPENHKRPLPVTVIPAPPRGRGISLRELEEARKSGTGVDTGGKAEMARWTGNGASAVPAVVKTAKEQAAGRASGAYTTVVNAPPRPQSVPTIPPSPLPYPMGLSHHTHSNTTTTTSNSFSTRPLSSNIHRISSHSQSHSRHSHSPSPIYYQHQPPSQPPLPPSGFPSPITPSTPPPWPQPQYNHKHSSHGYNYHQYTSIYSPEPASRRSGDGSGSGSGSGVGGVHSLVGAPSSSSPPPAAEIYDQAAVQPGSSSPGTRMRGAVSPRQTPPLLPPPVSAPQSPTMLPEAGTGLDAPPQGIVSTRNTNAPGMAVTSGAHRQQPTLLRDGSKGGE